MNRKDLEFEIAINGPNLDKSDVVVNEAMNLFWNNKGGDESWYFLGTSVIEKLKHYDGDSEVLHRILKKKNNMPFIN